MPKLYKRLFIPDTHTPFHDPQCVKVLLDVARDFRPDEVVYLGDWWDCYSVSSYDKDPEKNFASLKDELLQGLDILHQVEKVSRANRFVFLQGNHEYRIDRYLNTYASKLHNILPVREILQLPKSYTFYPYGQENHYRCGKLILTHGSLTNKHAAASMVAKYGHSVMFGHTHKIQEYQVRTITGECHRGINIGWLGDPKRAAEYVANVADWSNGFALGYFNKRGHFWTQIVHIINGHAVVNGKLY